MTNEQRMALVKALYNLIFTCKSQNYQQWQVAPKPAGYESIITAWGPRAFVQGTVRGIDVDVNDGGKILQLRFMEQNPNKCDKIGNLKETSIRARNGEFIMWMVDRKPGGGFLGSIQNGTWIASQMRAYAPAQYNAAGAVASHTEFSSDTVPDIPSGAGTPDYVIETMTEDMDFDPDDFGVDNFDPEAYDDMDIGEQNDIPNK